MGVQGRASRVYPGPRSRAAGRTRHRHPSGPRGEPLLGSLRRLRNEPLGLFVDGATRHGDLVAFQAAHRRVFLVVGPELIAHVAVGNRENYRKGVSYDALRVPIGDALLTVDGPAGQARRRLLMPLFTRRWLMD